VRYVATTAETRAADEDATRVVGESVLIARAAVAVATVAAQLLGETYGAQVTVLAGSGHNAADACLAGRHLARRGAAVTVLRSSDRDGDVHWQEAIKGLRIAASPDEVPAPDLIIDGLTGLGGRGGGLTGRARVLAAWADSARNAGAMVVAVDLPSGVEADSGAVTGPTVGADVTVTFDRHKPAHVLGEGAERSGSVVVVPVGLAYPATLPLAMLDADDVASLFPTPPESADKYSRGVIGVVAGSDQYPGAAVLCTGGAVRGGAGYVRYLGPELGGSAALAVRERWPTVVAGAGRVDAYVCGSGVGDNGQDDVRTIVASDTAAVLDAGALTLGVDAIRGRQAPTLLTPHAGEFERLTGIDPRPDPLGAARHAAQDLGVHVLLKGQRTVVAAPDGRALVNPTGSTWLSTAGTGDVLAGALGAMLAAAVKRAGGQGGVDVLAVGAAGAFLHGLAGRYSPVPLNATDLLETWAQAIAAVRG
jgi:hydroxyethylthiazole kinase-like uncharacterized protein yjeF